MEKLQFLSHSAIWAVFTKDGQCELRTRYAISALIMFALVTLSSISMTMGGLTLQADLAAALLWVILFFCAMAGLSRVFVQEQESGTIFTLRLYFPSQAVLFGKLLFNLVMLLILTFLLIPLFVLFLNVDIPLWVPFTLVLFLGNVGIAVASTLTASMVARTQGKSALFTVLTFPILLPQFLAAISLTAKIFQNTSPSWQEYGFLVGYDVVLCIAASILFDYLWYD